MTSPRAIDAASVRAYVARDWGLFERVNDRHWAELRSRGGFAEMLRITEMLRAQAIAFDPSWPRKTDREADLETHRRVAALLARIPDPRPRRTRGRSRGVRRRG